MYRSICLSILLVNNWSDCEQSNFCTTFFCFFLIVLIKGIHLTNKKIHNMKEENKQCTLLFWLIIDQTKIYNFHIIWISRPHLVSWLGEILHWKSSLEELPDIYSTSKWMDWCKDGKNPDLVNLSYFEAHSETNRCSFYSTAITFIHIWRTGLQVSPSCNCMFMEKQ